MGGTQKHQLVPYLLVVSNYWTEVLKLLVLPLFLHPLHQRKRLVPLRRRDDSYRRRTHREGTGSTKLRLVCNVLRYPDALESPG